MEICLSSHLERKNNTFESNRKVVSDNQKLIHSGTSALMQKLAEMSQLSSSLRTSLEQETKTFFAAQEKEHSGHNHRLNTYLFTIQGLLKKIKDQQQVEDEKLVLVERELQSVTSAYGEEVSSWGERLASTCSHIRKESNETTTKQIYLLNQSITILQSLIGSICSEIQLYLKEERDALTQSDSLSKRLATEKIEHLRRQNEMLAQWVTDERKSSENAQTDILQRFAGLLGEFFQKRDESLRESIESLERSNIEVEDLIETAGKREAKEKEEMLHRNNEMFDHLQGLEKQGHETKKRISQVGHSVSDVISNLMRLRSVTRYKKSLKGEWKAWKAWSSIRSLHIQIGQRKSVRS